MSNLKNLFALAVFKCFLFEQLYAMCRETNFRNYGFSSFRQFELAKMNRLPPINASRQGPLPAEGFDSYWGSYLLGNLSMLASAAGGNAECKYFWSGYAKSFRWNVKAEETDQASSPSKDDLCECFCCAGAQKPSGFTNYTTVTDCAPQYQTRPAVGLGRYKLVSQQPRVRFAPIPVSPKPVPIAAKATKAKKAASPKAAKKPVKKAKKTVKTTSSKVKKSTKSTKPKTPRVSSPKAPKSGIHDIKFHDLPDYTPPLSSIQPNHSFETTWRSPPVTPTDWEWVARLHPKEVELAATLKLSAQMYTDSKRRIFAEKVHRTEHKARFRKTDAQKACRIDVNKASRLFTVFERVGWFEPQWIDKRVKENGSFVAQLP